MAEPDAAVAIVHARAEDSVLLMRRAEHAEDAWSGHWSFPGGRCEPQDSDPLHTALRELEEECGVRLTRGQLHAALPLSVARRRVGRFLLVAPFVFDIETERPASLDAQEAVEALWVPLSVLRDPARHALRPVPGLPPEVLFPAIDLNGVPLWGFTYRLITDWLELTPRGSAVEEAGVRTARALLDWIIAHGCTLEHDWADREGAQVAAVRGAIPVELLRAHLPALTAPIPCVNRLEVSAGRIRLVGLAFEEYVISVEPDRA